MFSDVFTMFAKKGPDKVIADLGIKSDEIAAITAVEELYDYTKQEWPSSADIVSIVKGQIQKPYALYKEHVHEFSKQENSLDHDTLVTAIILQDGVDSSMQEIDPQDIVVDTKYRATAVWREAIDHLGLKGEEKSVTPEADLLMHIQLLTTLENDMKDLSFLKKDDFEELYNLFLVPVRERVNMDTKLGQKIIQNLDNITRKAQELYHERYVQPDPIAARRAFIVIEGGQKGP